MCLQSSSTITSHFVQVVTELHFKTLMADSDLLNNTLPQSIPHLILVDGWIPVLCAQMRRDKVVNLLSQVLIGRLSVITRTEK